MATGEWAKEGAEEGEKEQPESSLENRDRGIAHHERNSSEKEGLMNSVRRHQNSSQ